MRVRFTIKRPVRPFVASPLQVFELTAEARRLLAGHPRRVRIVPGPGAASLVALRTAASGKPWDKP